MEYTADNETLSWGHHFKQFFFSWKLKYCTHWYCCSTLVQTSGYRLGIDIHVLSVAMSPKSNAKRLVKDLCFYVTILLASNAIPNAV